MTVPFMKIYTHDNGSQSPAIKGAKNLWVMYQQLVIPGCGSLTQGSMTCAGQSQHNTLEASTMKIRAKKLRVVQNMYVGTYNVRSLLGEDRLVELEEELKAIKWDIIGLSETRRHGENIQKLVSGNILYTIGHANKSQAGVDFIVHKDMAGNVIEFRSASERVAMLVVKINSKYPIKVIQVYAPTSAYDDEIVEEMYDEINTLMDSVKTHYTMVIGDFNAKIGTRKIGEDNIMGKSGIGERNERGERLIEFATSRKLYIANSKFPKKSSRKWTWKSPDGSVKNEIDFIMTNRSNTIEDLTVLNRVNTGSDHRLVRCKVNFNTRIERAKLVKPRNFQIDYQQLKAQQRKFQIELRNRFGTLKVEDEDIDKYNHDLVATVKTTAYSLAKKIKSSKADKISEATKAMLKTRREMKQDATKYGKIEYTELCKTLRKKMKNEIRSYNVQLIQEALTTGRGLKAAQLKTKEGRSLMVAIKTKDGSITTNRDSIVERCAEFYKELYSSTADRYTAPNATVTDDPIPEVLSWEVQYAIKQMKNNKAPGDDGIVIDIIKEGGQELYHHIAKLFTNCLSKHKTPEAWDNAIIILLHKKGDIKDINNYRPISLLSHMSKLFGKVIKNRIEKQLDFNQAGEQAGFRSGFSTTNHLQVITQLIEKTNEYEMPMYFAFVDYEKAFDSVEHIGIMEALTQHQINKVYVETLSNAYNNATSLIKLDKESNTILIQRGVRQGDTISPKLFNAGLEQIFRKLEWDSKGISINGEHLNHLRFADDIVLISNNGDEIEEMLNQLNKESCKLGMKMNMKKTKIMCNKYATVRTVKIGNVEVEYVDEYVYLGQLVTMNSDKTDEIKRRISAGWGAFSKYYNIMKSKMPMCLKRKIYNQCI